MRAPALRGWDFWNAIGSPRTVCAPMVDQSEKAFRLLTAELGTDLAYTPMLHSRLFSTIPTYRALHFDPEPERSRPLFAQLAGRDPKVVLTAARMIEAEGVDAIDLNFGCPQRIANKAGRQYGAFLLDEPDVVVSLVKTLADELSVPVTAKLRLLNRGVDATVKLCERLEDAGASVITVHGRTREQNKQLAGSASWEAIGKVVSSLSIPVIANGGVGCAEDVRRCLDETGAAAVMSSEALLENPALFCANRHPTTGEYLDQDALAERYLQLCELHPPTKGIAMARGHLFKMLHNGLKTHPHMRDALLDAGSIDEARRVTRELAALRWEQPRFHTPEARGELSWYRRYPRPSDEPRSSEAPRSDEGLAAALGGAERERAEAAVLEKRERRRRDRREKRARRRRTKEDASSSPAAAVQSAATRAAAAGGRPATS